MRRRLLNLALLALCAARCEKIPEHALSPATPPAQNGALALDGGSSDGTVATIEILKPGGPYGTATPSLRWTPLANATNYRIDVDDSEDCTSPLQTFNTTATAQTSTYLGNGLYYLCVTAFSADGGRLARSVGTFWVLAANSADPAQQNSHGGSGFALATPGLTAEPLFQDDWSMRLDNRDGGPPKGGSVAGPYGFGVFSDPNDMSRQKLVVTDRDNQRILVFASVPPLSSDTASVIIGQSGPTTTAPDEAAEASGASFGDVAHAFVCPDGELLATDKGRNRVLLWRKVPSESGKAADLVVGQTSFAGAASGTSATQLNQPTAAYCMAGKLLVLDSGNHRILVYNKIPVASGAAADYALGQADFHSGNSGCGDHHFGELGEATWRDGALWVVDSGNHRVLRFSQWDNAGAHADLVLGQADFNNCRPNSGEAVSPATLLSPTSMAWRDDDLAIADAGNHRVLFYRMPVADGQKATAVLGQINPRAHMLLQTPQADAVATPKGLLFDGSYIWVGDYTWKRLGIMRLP